jgi:hypothetical protein
VIRSLDQALYQVTLVVDGRERLLTEDNGRVFRRHSLLEVREALQALPLDSAVLRQDSAYDEMIGQPGRERDNTLEVPLSLELYQAPTLH